MCLVSACCNGVTAHWCFRCLFLFSKQRVRRTEGPIPPGRYNHSACMARGSLANKIIVSGGIGNVRPTMEDIKKYKKDQKDNERIAPPNHMQDVVLSDVWTFDLSQKIWSQVGVPDMVPMYSHLMCTFDNKYVLLLFFY